MVSRGPPPIQCPQPDTSYFLPTLFSEVIAANAWLRYNHYISGSVISYTLIARRSPVEMNFTSTFVRCRRTVKLRGWTLSAFTPPIALVPSQSGSLYVAKLNYHDPVALIRLAEQSISALTRSRSSMSGGKSVGQINCTRSNFRREVSTSKACQLAVYRYLIQPTRYYRWFQEVRLPVIVRSRHILFPPHAFQRGSSRKRLVAVQPLRIGKRHLVHFDCEAITSGDELHVYLRPL